MRVFIDWASQPLALIFSLLLLASVLLACRKIMLGMGFLLVGVLLFWIASAPWSANRFARHVEAGTTVSACQTQSHPGTPVVVLGAGLNAYLDSDSPWEVLSPETLQRTLKAVNLDTGANHFYLLGGGKTSRKLSDYMAQVMLTQGIGADRITAEQSSLSTFENAHEFSSRLPATVEPYVILVTSRLHLNRATALFEDHGYTVCGVGVGTLYAPSAGWVGLLPYIDSLEKTTLIWREWLATHWYRWRHGITHQADSGPSGW